MTRTTIAALGAATVLGLAPLAAPADAQERDSRGNRDDTFTFQQAMQPGSWLRVRTMNGSVEVRPASGNVAEVRGTKQWRRGDPEDVRIVTYREGNDVLICALWGEESSCDENGYRNEGRRGNRDRGNDVSVDFTVLLPKGVRVLASSVNGGVEVEGASAEVVAESVNGRVEASTSVGPVSASTVNGNVFARMSSLPSDADLEFSTVNGSVTIELPENFSADVEMQTVNGSLRSDWPLEVRGRLDPRRIRATIGGGGRKLEVSTVNGSVELRKVR